MTYATHIERAPSSGPVRIRDNGFRFVIAAGCLAISLACVVTASSAIAQDGSYDASWAPRNSAQKGIPGLFEDTYALGGRGQYADDMTAVATAVQADGKLLVAGFGWNTVNNIDQNACIVRRYNADGSVDASFGNAGAVVTNFQFQGQSYGDDCYAKSLAVQADGKILYAGQAVPQAGGPAPTALVVRLNVDGSADSSFNGNGFLYNFGKDLNSVMVASNGDILVAGSFVPQNFSDYDMYLGTISTSGTLTDQAWLNFGVAGSDGNETGNAGVLESWSSGTIGNFHSYDEVYVVGVVDNPAYTSGQSHHSCGVTAFRRKDGGAFSLDTAFNGSGFVNVDFPVGALDTDTICRTAARRPALNSLFGPTGVVVGGERYYTPNGAPIGSASYYALEEIDSSGAVTRHDSFGFFADLNEAGAFNSINSMVWDNLGKLVTVGYAGIGANGNQTYAPSDGVVRRFNPDYSVDGTFAADHSGTLYASLDNTGHSDLLPSQREYLNTIATDPIHGRVVFAGERSLIIALIPNLYSWFLGAVHDGNVVISDRIFANGFE